MSQWGEILPEPSGGNQKPPQQGKENEKANEG